MENEKLSLKEKLGFFAFSSASNVIYNFRGTYLLVFLTLVLKIDVGVAGVISALGTIWDAINDPMISTFANNHTFKSGEKIRPYTLICALPVAIITVLLFTNFHLDSTWTIVVSSIFYFLFQIVFTFMNIPYNSLASVTTSNQEERNKLNAFRGLGSCVGSAIGTAAVFPLLKLFGGGKTNDLTPDDSRALIFTVGVICLISIAGSLYQYFVSKERLRPTENEQKMTVIQGYKKLFKCKSWILNVLYIMGYSSTTALMMNNITYYATYSLGNKDLSTPILVFYIVAAIVSALLVPVLVKKFGRKMAMLIPLAIMFVGKLPFIFYPHLITVCINAFTSGVGLTSTFVLLNINRNTVSDILEVQNGQRMDSLVAGGDGMIDKISQALTIFAFTQVLKLNGFDQKATIASQAPEAVKTVIALIGWVPLIVCVLLAVVAFFIDPNKELEKEKAKHNNQQ